MLSNYVKFNWKDIPLILAFLVLAGFIHYKIYRSERNAVNTLEIISSQTITSFKIHPEKAYTNDFHDAREFIQNEQLVVAFFQAIADSRSYNREHDQALSQWGMQIRTNTAIVRVACHIPDHKPGVVAGTIFSDSGSGHFQSRSLLRWYQKYGHY